MAPPLQKHPRRTRTLRYVLLLAAIVGTWVAHAKAASAADTVTVNPSDNSGMLYDGESVTVTGTYTPTVPGALYECPSSQVTVGKHLNPNLCDPNNVVNIGTPFGAFTASMVYDNPFTPTGSSQVDCGVVACEIVVDQTSPGMVDSASPLPMSQTQGSSNACNGFAGAPSGSIVKSTTPAGGTQAAPTQVTAGQQIQVHLTWNASDFKPNGQTSSAEDCVQQNGTTVASLSFQQKPGPSNGMLNTSYTIPANAANGDVYCDRGRVSGTSAATGMGITEKSAILCFQVGPGAVLADAPLPILLPLSSVAVLLAVGFLMIRRRSTAA